MISTLILMTKTIADAWTFGLEPLLRELETQRRREMRLSKVKQADVYTHFFTINSFGPFNTESLVIFQFDLSSTAAIVSYLDN